MVYAVCLMSNAGKMNLYQIFSRQFLIMLTCWIFSLFFFAILLYQIMCKCIYRPNTGQQVKQETLGELKKKYKKVTFESFGVQNPPRLGLFKMLFFYQVTAEECEEHWQKQFDSSAKTCSHAFWKVRTNYCWCIC